MKEIKITKAEQQFLIQRKQQRDTEVTDKWLKSNGLNSDELVSTNLRLLYAQQTAHTLLTQHSNLLSDQQRTTLQEFQRKMQNKRIRAKINPNAANAVLNISSKINRQLFKKFRQLSKI